MKRKNIPKNSSGIYMIQSLITKEEYIGSAVKLSRRKAEHFCSFRKGTHGNGFLQRHFIKYGTDSLLFSIIEFCPKEKLIEREQYWIDLIHPRFNLCSVAGSRFGKKCTEETKQLLSTIAKKRLSDPAFIKMLSEKTKTQMSIPENIKNLSEKAKQRQSVPERNPMYGKHHKKESRLKIKEALEKRGGHSGKNNPNYGNFKWKKKLPNQLVLPMDIEIDVYPVDGSWADKKL